MANIALLYDKPSDAGAFSGGSWVAGLPLDNLKERDVQRLARTTDALTASTRFRVDLGTARPFPISSFALLNHNGTTAATWRIVVTNDDDDSDPGARTADTGDLPLWVPTVVLGSLPWGAFPWNGIDPDGYPAGVLAFHLLPGAVLGRYVWVYITDTANPAGYFQAGRFLAGEAWSPEVNASYGASIQYVDPSETRRTRGGRRLVSARPRHRLFRMDFEALTQNEAMGTAFEVQRRLGKAGDFLLCLDPAADGSIRFRQTIYAALSDLEPASITSHRTWAWGLTAEELV
ncbi:MAG TPA: hypothetical protein VGN96_15815 [Roseococcus sp.]|jgi:hypothetical protein|nr:hypothetical protein [Roseococcus sp.]